MATEHAASRTMTRGDIIYRVLLQMSRDMLLLLRFPFFFLWQEVWSVHAVNKPSRNGRGGWPNKRNIFLRVFIERDRTVGILNFLTGEYFSTRVEIKIVYHTLMDAEFRNFSRNSPRVQVSRVMWSQRSLRFRSVSFHWISEKYYCVLWMWINFRGETRLYAGDVRIMGVVRIFPGL